MRPKADVDADNSTHTIFGPPAARRRV